MAELREIIQIINRIFRSSSQSLTIDLIYNSEVPPITITDDNIGTIPQVLNKIFDFAAASIKINIKYDLTQMEADIANVKVISHAVVKNVEATVTHTKARPVIHTFVADNNKTGSLQLTDITDTSFKYKSLIDGTIYFI